MNKLQELHDRYSNNSRMALNAILISLVILFTLLKMHVLISPVLLMMIVVNLIILKFSFKSEEVHFSEILSAVLLLLSLFILARAWTPKLSACQLSVLGAGVFTLVIVKAVSVIRNDTPK